ncbi:T9SS type A sorting domain-containing protein [bacterium]|nr:T9SS type A sorting domain-containing protein [bacterium]
MKPVTICMLSVVIIVAVLTGFALADKYGTPVSTGGNSFKSVTAIDWSPDGKWIAMAVQGKSIIIHAEQDASTSDIWIVPTEEGTAINLTKNDPAQGIYTGCFGWPDFTYDSSEVTFTKMFDVFDGDDRRQEFTIEGINITTGEKRVILGKNSNLGYWNNDGRYMVYIDMTDRPVIENQDEFEFRVVEYDTGSEVYASTFPGDAWPRFGFGISSISHDNTHFLTSLYEKEDTDIDDEWALYKIPFDGGAPVLLVSQGSPLYPVYSPDGKWILYTNWWLKNYGGTNYGPYPDQFAQLCVYNVETGEVTTLLPDCPYWNYYGCWSPDGRQICYILRNKDTSELRILDFEFAEEELQLDVEDNAPVDFALKGNYPNPFNPSTTIEFSLHDAGQVTLSVYNAAGQKIRTLVSGSMSSGIHSVVWNGCDDAGIQVSAGIYFSRLEMNGAAETSKMILMK